MKRIFRLLFISLMLSFTLAGCYYDKEDILYKSPTVCDTSNVTYTVSIAPIMASNVYNCNICHSKTVASGSVVTDNYEDLKFVALSGKLKAAVNWTGPYHMPKGSNKISNCDLAKMNIWIDGGALKK